MSVDATRWAWTVPVKNSTQRLVLLSLADRAGEHNTCFPSVARITTDTCLDRKTIMKAISQMIEDGLLEDTGHRKGATKQVVVYRLLGVASREDDQINSTKNGTVPKLEQYQISHETVPNFPINSTKNGTRNLKGTKKESNNSIKFDFASELKKLGANDQLIKDWIAVRKTKKAGNTKTALDGFTKQVEKSGLPLNTVLEICIVRDWKGFNSSWLANINLSEYQSGKPQQAPIPANFQTDTGDW